MGLATVKLINEAHYNNEFQLFIIYGPLGYGKSSLALQTLAEVYHTWDINILKKYLFFHPQSFLDRCYSAGDGKEPEKCIVWDDAGLWLYALDYNSPFVKGTTKYINVARTDFSSIIMTAPLPTWVVSKIRYLPQCITIKIIKQGGQQGTLRRGKAYRYWVSPDMKRSGVHTLYEDDFDVMLPNDVYEWYQPIRKKYAALAKALMSEGMKDIKRLEGLIEGAA
jgi:hypothetical protein